jgi:hypothetical protein
MTDTVFGTFITDDLKLVNYRAVRTGVHHRHDIMPLDPNPGEAVSVRVMTPGRAGFEHLVLYYTTDGSIPTGSRGVAENGEVVIFERERIEWDAMIWGYLIHWHAVIPGQPDQTMVQYVISAWSEDGDEVYADTPNVDDKVQHETMQHFDSIPEDSVLVETGHFVNEEVFNYHVDRMRPPQWAEDAVIYHVFIDRFYPGDGRGWLQTKDMNRICGGTLWGVRDKLDYFVELGVNCLWLSPTWPSPTYHGYDVTDYERVEPRLGGDEALRAVVEGAHQRGIRVLLDMVCNHLSNQHPIFLDALHDEKSAYRDWFFFDERVPNGYKTFFGVAEMPRVNLNLPAASEWMVANAVRWLRDYDVDGYRLDVADGPGPNFWAYFRKACREAKADCLVFGEIIDTPQRLRTYAGRLDGCLDFPLNDALRQTFALHTMTEAQLDAFLSDNASYYPDDFVAPTFLDNHDMNRFSYLAGNDPETLKRAAALQLQLPGPAIIYYGTEVGLKQEAGLHEQGYSGIRAPMIWGEDQDHDLLAFYKGQIQARKEERVALKMRQNP